MSNNGNAKAKPPITGWVKVTARMDGSIQVEHPDVNMDNPKNVAAVLDLLAAGVSTICHKRLFCMGEQSRIVPAQAMPRVMKKVGT